MKKPSQRHYTPPLFITILLLLCTYNTLGNLYKLESRSTIWHDDILEEFDINSKIQCASTCNQKNKCIGFGISSKRCFLLKSAGNEDVCEESCLDLHEVKVYLSAATSRTKATTTTTSDSTTTTTDLPTTKIDSPATTTRSLTTAKDSITSTMDKPETTTKEPRTVQEESSIQTKIESSTTTMDLTTTTTELTTTTTHAPSAKLEICNCTHTSKNGYYNGFRAFTKFYRHHEVVRICQCMGKENIYVRKRHASSKEPVQPGTMVRCRRWKKAAVVSYRIFFGENHEKIDSYRTVCDEFLDGIVDTNSEVTLKSSAPENKEVKCDDYQAIVGFQAIEQEDGSYELRIECLQLIPK